MPRYIDADYLDELITQLNHEGRNITRYEYKMIDSVLFEFPTADVVERKHGEWIFDTEPYPLGNPYGHYGCDQCGEYVPHKTNFCPFCGADMRKETEDE